jgi:hypothetical protein
VADYSCVEARPNIPIHTPISALRRGFAKVKISLEKTEIFKFYKRDVFYFQDVTLDTVQLRFQSGFARLLVNRKCLDNALPGFVEAA